MGIGRSHEFLHFTAEITAHGRRTNHSQGTQGETDDVLIGMIQVSEEATSDEERNQAREVTDSFNELVISR